MVRIDIPPTSEGNEPRLFYTPFILSPGYGYYISTTVLEGQEPAYLIGYAETFPAAGVLGYGGLIRRADSTPVASIPAGTWITLDFEEGSVTVPVNLTQEPGNNRISLEDGSNNALWSYTSLIEVPEALVGKYIRQEFGGSASAFSNVIFHKLGQTFIRIAPEIGA